VHNASWADDNHIVFAYRGRLFRLPATGGVPVPISRTDTSAGARSTPFVLPGSKAALISVFPSGEPRLDNAGLGVIDLRSGAVRELGIAGGNPRYVPGYVVFVRADGTVLAAPFSLRSLRVTGPSIPIADHVRIAGSTVADFATSASGAFVYYKSSTAVGRLVVVDRQGRTTVLTAPQHAYTAPRLDPSGERFTVTVGGVMEIPIPRAGLGPRISEPDGAPRDVWTYELPNGPLTRVTTGGRAYGAEWTPDGRRLVFVREDTARPTRYLEIQPWDGSGEATVFHREGIADVEVSIGPAQSYIAVRRGQGSSAPLQDIWIAPSDSPQALRPFIASPSAGEWEPRVSPDGKFLAYTSDESGTQEVYVRPLPGPGARVQVSLAGGREPMWSPNGRELFYRVPGFVMSATLERGERITVSSRQQLFADAFAGRMNHANFDVFADGQRFLFIEMLGGKNELFAIFNLHEALKRRTQDTSR
jgi:serine/threonine-protein kinase